MAYLIQIVSLFVLFSSMTAVKIDVGQYCLTCIPNPKSGLVGQAPYLGWGLIGSCDWIQLAGPGGSSVFCDSYNYTCLGLNKGPNTITLKLQNLEDISQQWAINPTTLQLTNGAVSSNLCASAANAGLLGNPLLFSPLNMQPCISPLQQFIIA